MMITYADKKKCTLTRTFASNNEINMIFFAYQEYELIGEIRNDAYETGLAYIVYNGEDVCAFASNFVEVL